ncbi:putative phosphoenolpyruvate synthase [Caerostris extrusa]|uniref:Phosphoenolpyruvate synthase n=1 Tax=Caerostris extrusa TaxID=172846 RepID=A0AAV4WN39_CAEEX|nr:putative phosphoenolpyruvate synthase [Caerostris extrusa]
MIFVLKSADEVIFYGVNSKSECLLVRIARGCNQTADAWIYLKLANGKTYCLAETVEGQQLSDENSKTFFLWKFDVSENCRCRRSVTEVGKLSKIPDVCS